MGGLHQFAKLQQFGQRSVWKHRTGLVEETKGQILEAKESGQITVGLGWYQWSDREPGKEDL